MKISIKQLRKRILQPTAELMAELGGVVETNGTRYAYRDNGAPVLGVAHCDYVDRGSDHFHAHNGMVWSSRLDDRLGVYVILDLLPSLGITPDILLTDDEESGRSSAQHFYPSKKYNWMFQFDRRGDDVVCYEYEAMERYCAEYFDVGHGTFSDICWLDHLGICGVNVGTAYYEEHTLGSYAILSKLARQVKQFTKLYAEFSDHRIEHIPPPPRKFLPRGRVRDTSPPWSLPDGDNGHRWWDDDDYLRGDEIALCDNCECEFPVDELKLNRADYLLCPYCFWDGDDAGAIDAEFKNIARG